MIYPRLEHDFTISTKHLQQMVKHLANEMRKGLAADGHTVRMIPSYIVKRPTGDETGSYLALDLGGSNFRVCLVTFEGQGRARVRQSKHVVTEDLKVAHGDVLFGFFAECIETFLKEQGLDVAEERKLGFTFSFPIKQTAVNRGTLMQWNKGYQCEGVVGKDVVELLGVALKKRGLNVKVTALVNDTVGTLISHAYKDSQTLIAVILGTGTNAAYVESLSNLTKPLPTPSTSEEMIINTEWGAYDQEHILPTTLYDQQLDRASSNPRKQIFEKMISGMYLGEIVRFALLDLIGTGELFKGEYGCLKDRGGFETAWMSRIERDHSIELSDTRSVLEDLVHIPHTTVSDRRMVKHVCELVGIRAARLSAAGIAAILTKTNRLSGCTVAVDGSVFEHYPHFSNRMGDALRELLGLVAEGVVLEQARDGSGIGAALCAALHG
ncbi:hypothetical protein BC832DRAFT_535257 [Gaertneriomyces semiglobifer]|nr:hypothetical protein BC832DRAFT_535257 [Gaertneriomyces semiglobifer]